MLKLVKRLLCVACLAGLLVLGAWSVYNGLASGVTRNQVDTAEELEDTLTNRLPYRELLLDPFRIANVALGRTYYRSHNIYIREDGMYLQGSSLHEVTVAADGLEGLDAFCQEHDIQFLHVILPSKPQYDEDVWARGIPCNRNRTADRLGAELDARGVPRLDLREAFRCDDYYARWFYATDHHWTPEAALVAARLISQRLNDEYGYQIDLSRLADDQFVRETSSLLWVGELGSKALGSRGTLDEFTAVLPAYPVSLRLVDEPAGVDETGGFEVLLDEGRLEQPGPVANTSLYYYYWPGSSGIVDIYDNDVQGGNVLLVHDSFSNAMAPFLALGVEHLTLWDMRYTDDSLYEYLEAHPEIDTVIVAYSLSFVPTSYMNTFY